MKNINMGIVGVSNRGRIADLARSSRPGVSILSGADPNHEALRAFGERHPSASAYDNYLDLLSNPDIDAVFICSPDFCHEEQAVAALEAGKAVYLEKPMAITIEGCDRILDTAARTGSKLFLGHNMRYFESILTMKKLIDEGVIGAVQAIWCRHFISYGGDAYFKDWHSEQSKSTGLLLQKGAHDIDVIHWLAGGYTQSVTAMGKLSVYSGTPKRAIRSRGDASFNLKHWPPENQKGMSPVIDVEDHSMVLMQLENGVQASYTQCHYTPDAWRNYTVIGTRGRIENQGDSGDCLVGVYNRRTDGFGAADTVLRLEGTGEHHGGADRKIVGNFIDYVRDIAAPAISPLAARNAVAAGVMATLSLRNGSRPADIPVYRQKSKSR